jgi:hypothetical protein
MNARSESAAEKPAFRDAFSRGQFAIVPAWEIFEPFYAPGAKRSVRWGIERADGTALGICGLWDRWKSPTGEIVLSFAMLTINCDEHPLLKRFHKHFDEKGEPNERRTPALLREEDYDRWLDASPADAPAFFNTFGSDDLQARASPAIPPKPKAGPPPDAAGLAPLQRVTRALELILEVEAERGKRISTSEVNEKLGELTARLQPPQAAGREVKLNYATQVETDPPTFAVFGNAPDLVEEHYVRFLHNGFRETYPFTGNPLRILMRRKSGAKSEA